MDNPLSEEQIKRINEIAKLLPEKQQPELQKFLKTLSKEQIAFLQAQQQGPSCVFCSIAEGKVDSKRVYQDDNVLAVLDINPANLGHTLVFPRKHVEIIAQLNEDEQAHIFKVANKIAAVLFDTLKAEGTNIFVANGPAAGQNTPHALVHVIPRFKDDKLQLTWAGKKASEKDLENIKLKLEGKIKFEEKVLKQEVSEFDVDAEEEYRLP